MSIGRKIAVATILVISSSLFCLKSQDSIPLIQVIEAVGEIPPASIYKRESLSSNNVDSLTKDFLSDIFSVLSESQAGNDTTLSSVDSQEAFSVFDFITSAYRSKSFYESGGSDGLKSKRRLQMYDGPLPKIDESKFCRPVKGRITSSFGTRPDSDKIHYGVDFAGKKGDTVRVALPGIVTMCAYDKKGYGWYVCVTDSSGLEMRYAHLSKVLVARGDRLQYQAPVGLVGSTGNSTGPHLHFEIRYKGRAVNPIFYILK